MSNNNSDIVDGGLKSPTTSTSNITGPFRPVYKHWFFNQTVATKPNWTPMTMTDSLALEEAYTSGSYGNRLIPTEGGRHDVDIEARTRKAVYWTADDIEVRRCSWFYKALDTKFIPYEEDVAEILENEYKEAYESKQWQRKVTLPNGVLVNFHGPNVMVHYLETSGTEWRPRVVKRGVDEFNIEDGEPEKIDHVLFMVHGIGASCDLRFRSVEEVGE